jgi:hypothetical protein
MRIILFGKENSELSVTVYILENLLTTQKVPNLKRLHAKKGKLEKLLENQSFGSGFTESGFNPNPDPDRGFI